MHVRDNGQNGLNENENESFQLRLFRAFTDRRHNATRNVTAAGRLIWTGGARKREKRSPGRRTRLFVEIIGTEMTEEASGPIPPPAGGQRFVLCRKCGSRCLSLVPDRNGRYRETVFFLHKDKLLSLNSFY